MPDDKILRFPRGTSTPTESDKDGHVLMQRSLFEHPGMNRGRIVFLDVTWLVEESLLNLVARNGVTALIDLRPRPVFERPRFRHRHIVHYLYERNVRYLEYAMIARIAPKSGVSSSWPYDREARFREILKRGLTICLYDDGSRSAGWVDEVRHVLRTTPDYLAEMHPRALVGAPDAAGRR